MGELSALACAVLWGCSTVALRSQAGRVPVLAINAIRTAWSTLFFLGLLAAAGRLGEVATIPVAALGGLMLSVLVGMALGDTLHFRAMKSLGVARAMPISSSYPILTAALAVVILGEPVSWRTAAGILLTIGGVYLVAFPRVRGRIVDPAGGSARTGITLALCAALCWSISTIAVRPALDLVDPLLANGFRLPLALLVLGGLSLRNEGFSHPFAYGRRPGLILALAGLLSGASGALWLEGVLHAGAARASTLSSTAPVFAAPLAVLLLGEKMSLAIAIGTVLTIAGIWMIL